MSNFFPPVRTPGTWNNFAPILTDLNLPLRMRSLAASSSVTASPLENSTDSDDSNDEAVTPELYQDSSDEEILLQPPTQPQEESTVTCDICMDREPDVFIVPCGHQNMCGPCAHQEKELRGKCPYDMKPIQQIIPKIPM